MGCFHLQIKLFFIVFNLIFTRFAQNPAGMQSIYSRIEELRLSGKAAAICIVIETRGSTPRKQGAKMIVYADGSIEGTIGGGSVELDVIRQAKDVIISGIARKFVFNLGDDLGMHCGGEMEVFIEPLISMQTLYIFGAGHIGNILATLSEYLDFRVVVIDPREELLEKLELMQGSTIHAGYLDAIINLDFDAQTYMVIVTPNHQSDEEILASVARKPHKYLGLIGSRRKIALLRERFLKEQLLTEEEMDGVDMPIGLPIKAQTPAEIAVSILGKLIEVRNSE